MAPYSGKWSGWWFPWGGRLRVRPAFLSPLPLPPSPDWVVAVKGGLLGFLCYHRSPCVVRGTVLLLWGVLLCAAVFYEVIFTSDSGRLGNLLGNAVILF